MLFSNKLKTSLEIDGHISETLKKKLYNIPQCDNIIHLMVSIDILVIFVCHFQ